MSTQATTFRQGHRDVLHSRIKGQLSRLSFEQYVDSVKEVLKGERWHVDSSSRPSSVREVRLHEDGHYSCSCPAGSRRAHCVHRKAVVEFLAPIELRIAEPAIEAPCCYGCKTKSSLGCYRNLSESDTQWIQSAA
jgi:hypothetical protein